MRKFLLDTGIASDCVNRRLNVESRVQEAARRGDRVGIGTPVLGELLAGIQNSNDPDRHRNTLWRCLARIKLWVFDKSAAEVYGKLCADLKKSGRPLPQIDIQIAAIALSLGNCTVVTKDSDFAAIPQLDVEDWSKA